MKQLLTDDNERPDDGVLVLVAAVQQDEPQPQQQQEQAARHQEQDQLPDKIINTLLLKYIKIYK